jgi:hypothetical protein
MCLNVKAIKKGQKLFEEVTDAQTKTAATDVTADEHIH